MDTYSLKTLPNGRISSLIKDIVTEKYLQVLSHKCIIISKEQYIQLCVENFFYHDNGVLWVTMKLSPESKKKQQENEDNSHSNRLRYNLNFVTSEIHRRLYTDNISEVKSERIVPLVGSNLVEENVAYTNEDEFFNIVGTFGVNTDDVNVTFHPINAFENSPKIAASAEVSLSINEYELENDFLKEVLSNYFETPKAVSLNDMISINLTPTNMSKYNFRYIDLVDSCGKLYFKCKKLETDESSTSDNGKTLPVYYIVKGVTQLTLGDGTHTMKPKNKYFEPKTLNQRHISHICPTGLKDRFNQIQETIKPFLTGQIDEMSSSLPSPIIPMILLTGPIGSGRHLLVRVVTKYNGLNFVQFDCNSIQNTTAKQTESKISSMIQKAKSAAPIIVLLDNFDVLAVDSENNEDFRITEYFNNTVTNLYENYTKHPIIFIALAEKMDLKPNMMRMFLEKVNFKKLNVEQRRDMLQWFISVMNIKIDDDEKGYYEKHQRIIDGSEKHVLSDHMKDVLFKVASKTETFLQGDLDVLMHFALRESYLKQAKCPTLFTRDANLRFIQEEDFDKALETMRSLQSQHLDAPKIPKVYWEDIGGLAKLKKELLKTIEFPIKYPHLFKSSSLKRSGILLYGPPGCGKTLVAKAVSTELNVSFMSVKGPELLNMYIGQSEENVRKVFSAARASSPCIVFLDELDALAPRRGATGDSGGASDRVVSQLLAEVDGVDGEDSPSSSFVFIMGATNRPDLLEQSLLRPGRLDKLVYVGPYTGLAEKTSVLTALCRSYKLRPEVDLEAVAATLPESCTGADLLQVTSTARAAAVRGLVEKLNNGLVKESDLSADSVVIGVSDFWEGVEAFRPSVTEEELAYYESLQRQF
ncbi:unnamed protein product [Danaus chrysippus]|uniref:Peroxisomal ATPase PEX6 n=1 Tax=Danaus chrysippus TaxID=151541 RepID=A0A8J2QNW0_9NEOP|nr:unnamed protein product [Danaus chrysippus]